MAGDTVKAEAICLDIRPWSRTSHVVSWLTPSGRIATIVKGAVRPKSFFLGQYDLNYTCSILYYARARGEVHALREAFPINRRDALRDDYRSLTLAGYFRRLTAELAPTGPESAEWMELLSEALDALPLNSSSELMARLIFFEKRVLELMGLMFNLDAAGGEIMLRGERKLLVSEEVAACIVNPLAEKKLPVLLDTARVFSVYYQFHVDCAIDIRRTVFSLISK